MGTGAPTGSSHDTAAAAAKLMLGSSAAGTLCTFYADVGLLLSSQLLKGAKSIAVAVVVLYANCCLRLQA